ncbi:unnamed protein product [Spirodela intermedia]|uniref:Uncharacterized protein n=1 Tax=Spirodela intermedia TaxID=51605 RepID=A0A7I8J521_SPIIN|nr:unnamed protein product [Spirodela intermedia]CAA6665336.1 unnamed protein product [Spirodela intermedia]
MMEAAAGQGGSGGAAFARGGPIYVPTSSDPSLAWDLQAELSTAGDFDDELSVDELRVFTEEEIVEKALEASGVQSSHPSCIICTSNSRAISLVSSSTGGESLDSKMPHGKDPLDRKVLQSSKNRKKRGRLFDRDTRASELESANVKSVERFARIKQSQDEDKAAARLHSFWYWKFQAYCGATSTAEATGKLRSLRFIKSFPKVTSSNKLLQNPVSFPEVVLCVEVYDNRVAGHKTQELLVLGSQRLTALRDNIYCSTDHLMQASGVSDPSGYFLIEDLFLNDLRGPGAIDYSKPILEWLVNQKKEAKDKWEWIVSSEVKKHKSLLENLTSSDLPQFKAVDMDKTCFCDLRFRFGSGYLYCHQGNCWHLIVIRDMRLVHADDEQNELKCSVCNIKPSAMATVNDRWAARNPCFFCKDCYYLLHYRRTAPFCTTISVSMTWRGSGQLPRPGSWAPDDLG